MPYLRSKLHAIYNKEREVALQASLWGEGDERFTNDYFDAGANSIVSTSSSDTEASARERFKKKIQKVVAACYPWIHAGNEGLGSSTLGLINILGFQCAFYFSFIYSKIKVLT